MAREKPRTFSLGGQDAQAALARLKEELTQTKAEGVATAETLEATSDITPANPSIEGASPAHVEEPGVGGATEAEVDIEKISTLVYDLTDNLKVPLQFSRPYSPGFLKSMAGRVANRLHDSLYTASGDAKTGKSLDEAYQEIRASFDDETDIQSILQKEALDQIVAFLKQPRTSSPETPAPTESGEIGTAPTNESSEIYASDPEVFRLNNFIQAIRKEREKDTTPHITPIVLDGTTKGIQTGHWSKKESLPAENTDGLQVDTQTTMPHAERSRLEKEIVTPKPLTTEDITAIEAELQGHELNIPTTEESLPKKETARENQEKLPSLPFTTEQIDHLRGLGVPEETLSRLLLAETEDAKKIPEKEATPTTSLTPEEIVLPEGVRAALASLDKKIEETTGTPKEADWKRIKKGVRAFLDKYVVEKDLPRIQNLLDALARYMESGSAPDLERTLAQKDITGKKEAFRTVAEEENEIREAQEEIAKGPTLADEEDALREALQEKDSPLIEVAPVYNEKQMGLLRSILGKGATAKLENLTIPVKSPETVSPATTTKKIDSLTDKEKDSSVDSISPEMRELYEALGPESPKGGGSYEYLRAEGEKDLVRKLEAVKTEVETLRSTLARLKATQNEAIPAQHKGFFARMWSKMTGSNKVEAPIKSPETAPLLGTETLIATRGDTAWDLLRERIPKIPGFENLNDRGLDFATDAYIAHIGALSLPQVRSLGFRNTQLNIWGNEDLTPILNPENLPKPFDFEEVLKEIRKRGI